MGGTAHKSTTYVADFRPTSTLYDAIDLAARQAYASALTDEVVLDCGRQAEDGVCVDLRLHQAVVSDPQTPVIAIDRNLRTGALLDR